ncbi:hypothetical protein [Persephonella sp. IF05-L8]|uniref:hypothetical protein n=1 Tax=Persephonella sp. IF05-L8 TaxID=1158338 RepID=UPI0004977924
MKKKILLILIPNIVFASENKLTIGFGYLDFEKSAVKRFGYLTQIGYNTSLDNSHTLLFHYQQADIKTTNRVKENLHIKKYFSGYIFNKNKKKFILSFLYVKDNVLKEASDIKVIGAGLGYKNLIAKQYFEKFKRFNVYQTDLKYTFFLLNFKTQIIGKYIHIPEKKSIAKKAKSNYLTLGLIVNKRYKNLYGMIGAFTGKRIFSIMKDGKTLQHHPMEFSYSLSIKAGKKVKHGDIFVSFMYSKAKELPFNNPNVKIKNISAGYNLVF